MRISVWLSVISLLNSETQLNYPWESCPPLSNDWDGHLMLPLNHHKKLLIFNRNHCQRRLFIIRSRSDAIKDEVIKRLHETEKPFMPLVQLLYITMRIYGSLQTKTEKLYMLFTLYQKERNFQKQ